MDLPIEELLPQTRIERTLFRNSASNVAGLQVHVTLACHTF